MTPTPRKTTKKAAPAKRATKKSTKRSGSRNTTRTSGSKRAAKPTIVAPAPEPADDAPDGPLVLSEIQAANAGLACPKCGCRHFFTPTTRRLPGAIRRYRKCRHCGRIMTTRERPE